MLMKSVKGFVTTVGFDLPSIIPIVVGLLIFFGVLGYSITGVNAKNAEMKLERDGLTIANSLRQDGYIVGGTLVDKCSSALNINATFLAMVTSRENLPGVVAAETVRGAVDAGELREGDHCRAPAVVDATPLKNRAAKIVYVYPVIYQDPDEGAAGLEYKYLTIVLWK